MAFFFRVIKKKTTDIVYADNEIVLYVFASNDQDFPTVNYSTTHNSYSNTVKCTLNLLNIMYEYANGEISKFFSYSNSKRMISFNAKRFTERLKWRTVAK